MSIFHWLYKKTNEELFYFDANIDVPMMITLEYVINVSVEHSA